MNHVARLVPLEDLFETSLDSDGQPRRAGCEVSEGQRVRDCRLLARKLIGERSTQPARLGLDRRSRVVCDKPTEALGRAQRAEVASAVERVKVRVPEFRGIANVMKPGSRDEEFSLPCIHCLSG